MDVTQRSGAVNRGMSGFSGMQGKNTAGFGHLTVMRASDCPLTHMADMSFFPSDRSGFQERGAHLISVFQQIGLLKTITYDRMRFLIFLRHLTGGEIYSRIYGR